MEFVICVAGKNILIRSVYASILNTCRDYLTDPDTMPDFIISTDESMILAELKQLRHLNSPANSSMVTETLLIHRLIAEALLNYDTFLMHGAVISVDGVSYMFTGHSGTGKTTHIEKWLKNANGSFVVNGDKPLIQVKDDSVYACGTPWRGKENYGSHAIVPLRAIALMERSKDNWIEEVSFKSVFSKLLEQTHCPADADKMRKTLVLLKALNGKVKFYKFHFNNMKDDAFEVAYKGMR